MSTIDDRVALKAARTRRIRSLHPDEISAHAPDPFAVDLVKAPAPAYGTAPEQDRSAPERTGAPQDAPGTDLVEYSDDVLIPAQPVPVQVHATALPGQLRPIVPGWMKTREGRRNMTRWWLIKTWHAIRFHGIRAPGIAFRVLVRAPRGAYRGLSFLWHWALDTRADPMEQELAAGNKGDAPTFLKIREDRARRIRARLVYLTLMVLVATIATCLVVLSGSRLIQAVAGTLVVTGFGRMGTDPGKPLITAMMIVQHRGRELTDAIVMRMLKAAGLGGSAARIDPKSGDELAEDTRPKLAQPIQRAENGSGYLVDVYLPYGSTVADADAAKDKMASAVDVDEVQVFVEKVPGSARRVLIYIADHDPFLGAPRRCPLAKLPKVSVFDAHPIGAEPRGREARPDLVFNSFLIGAIPRSGKTFAGRALISPALLDPYCDMTILDFKGGKDWKAAEPLCVTFRSGDDEEDLLYALAVLNNLKAEAQARFKDFQAMDDDRNPEGKLTRELAREGYRPHVIVLDEVQNLLRASDRKIRAAALEVLIWLAKTGPAAGFILVMLTQRPAADVIPSDLRDNTSVRIALRTKTWQSSDAILGSGINAIGFGTQRFLEEHKGAAILGGVSNGRGGDLSVIRIDLVTIKDYTQMCLIGRQRRIDAGTLRGAAVGARDDVVITVTVLDDVRAVWPGDEPKVQGQVLLDRLKEIHPTRHANTQLADLTRALKAEGVPVVQVFRDGSNANGYSLASIEKAAARSIEA